MKYVVADDHPSTHLFLCHLLKMKFKVGSDDIVSVTSTAELFERLDQGGSKTEYLFLDLLMPGELKRLALVDAVLAHSPWLRIIVHTADTSSHLAQAMMQRGVAAYTTKRSPKALLIDGIAAVFAGGDFIDPAIDMSDDSLTQWHSLTPKEKAIALDVCSDLKPEAIAERHAVSKKTVSMHKRAAMDKLAVSNEAGLSNFLFKNGLAYLLDR